MNERLYFLLVRELRSVCEEVDFIDKSNYESVAKRLAKHLTNEEQDVRASDPE